MSGMLAGKVALVTGAGRGIGRAVAEALAAQGAAVALAARTPEQLNQTRTAIERSGGKAISVPTDICREDDVRRLVETALNAYDRLDIVINNAAVGRFGPLERMSVEDWDLVMAVNARGPFLVCRETIPHLRKQPVSWIVNIGSVVSVKGYVNQSAYSASKHALLGMTKALARELQPDNIRVHAVCPGGVDTEFVGAARPDLDRSVLITPAEVAQTVLMLLSQSGNAVIDEIHIRRAAATPWA
jgi:3-oxoacyl-[acyl-carrier protein] reductase